jgi:hypothetical protein
MVVWAKFPTNMGHCLDSFRSMLPTSLLDLQSPNVPNPRYAPYPITPPMLARQTKDHKLYLPPLPSFFFFKYPATCST